MRGAWLASHPALVCVGDTGGAPNLPAGEVVWPMLLSEAVGDLRAQLGDELVVVGDAEVHDATHDSREVTPDSVYCAIVGARHDGHDFAARAVEGGASALLVERQVDLDVAQVIVPSVRAAIGPLAARVHRRPSDDLVVIGVTGTNGKTTTCYLLETIFGQDARGTGVVGTIETRIHGEPRPGARTTPEATDLQRLLATMRERGVDAVAMEVSSHGLDQHRVDGTRFRVAVFTNLGLDHLDYHGTQERYFAAKARLFTPELADRAVICVDDSWGRRLASQTAIPTTTFGTHPEAQVAVERLRSSRSGTTCVLRSREESVLLETPLIGEHNGLNAAAAFLAARAVGIAPDVATRGIAVCDGVPGRLEPVDVGQPFAVLVDYAHTPDALQRAVDTARELAAAGRVHVVIGCGGDRDREKRPEMGRIAAEAGHAVLTSDNPRSEDPEAILAEVEAGAARVVDAEVTVRADRRQAIAVALRSAASGDVVLIAGKGHESTQEFADRTIAFDDRAVATEELERLGWRREVVA